MSIFNLLLMSGGIIEPIPTLPVLGSITINDYTSSIINVTASVTSDGGATITERGFCYSTSQNPTISGSHITVSGTTGSMTGNITELNYNTLYYIRAYAKNSVGISYSTQVSQRTKAIAPTVGSISINDYTSSIINATASVTSNGGATITERGFCYGTSQNPTVSGSHVTVSGTTGSMTGNITGLNYNTLYYLRAYAKNAIGTSYSTQASQRTKPIAPTVGATTISNITTSSFNATASVTSNGGATITERGFCYGTSQNPTVSGSHITISGTTGSMTGNITGLTKGVTYYVRAYAKNSVGTSYGTQSTAVIKAHDIEGYLYDYYEGMHFTFTLNASVIGGAGTNVDVTCNSNGYWYYDIPAGTTIRKLVGAFYMKNNLKSISFNFNTETITTLNSTFDGCSHLQDISGLSNINTSNVVDMWFCFHACSNLSNITALSTWNVSNCNRFISMFADCTSLTNINALSSWTPYSGGVHHPTTDEFSSMQNMFAGCTSLTNINGISNWNFTNYITTGLLKYTKISNLNAFANNSTIGLTDSLCEYCTSLTDISALSNRDTDSASNAFAGCTSLQTVQLSNLYKPTDVNGMFYGCTNLKTLTLNKFDANEFTCDLTNFIPNSSNLTVHCKSSFARVVNEMFPNVKVQIIS